MKVRTRRGDRSVDLHQNCGCDRAVERRCDLQERHITQIELPRTHALNVARAASISELKRMDVNRNTPATHGNHYQTFAKSLIANTLQRPATHAMHATHEKGEPSPAPGIPASNYSVMRVLHRRVARPVGIWHFTPS